MARGERGRNGGARPRRRSLAVWWRLRKISRVVVWCLVVLVGGSMVAYFALALPSLSAR